MELSELKEALLALRNKKPGLIGIEKELGMPQNALAGMLSGKRKFPKKWVKALTEYVLSQKFPALAGGVIADLVEKGVAVTHVSSVGETSRVEPFSEVGAVVQKATVAAQTSQKSPPPGLSKPQTLRWLREHNQELR